MSETVQTPVQVFNTKRQDAELKLASAFVAFVPVKQKKGGPTGYMFYAAPKMAFVYLNNNFLSCGIGISSGHLREVENLFRDVESDIRTRYSDKDFHAITAIEVLAQYSRLILEWKDKPQAFCIESISVDCAGSVIVQGYDGDYTSYEDGVHKLGKIYLAGCYDKNIHSEVMEVLQENIMRENVSVAGLRKVIKRLQKITGHAIVGYRRV